MVGADTKDSMKSRYPPASAEPEAPKPEGGRVPDERVDETLPPEQRIGDAPKPNGKGRRQLSLKA